MIYNGLTQGEGKFPSYMDLAYPELQDNRTPEQIKSDIVSKLLA